MNLQIVKVCGIARLEDARVASEAGASAIGMIFVEGTPRFVDDRRAREIAQAVPAGVLKVGVFVNASRERLLSAADDIGLDILQLHGGETPELVASLAGRRVWKTFPAGDRFDPAAFAGYRCEAFLLDTQAEGLHGGAGKTFPWERAKAAARYGKIVVAGGLGPDNVAEAIRAVNPWGVDASSRLEARPGEKDPGLVRRYVNAALAARGERKEEK